MPSSSVHSVLDAIPAKGISMSGGQLLRAPADSSSSLATGAAQLRIALYSHDTMGVGHMRRNMLIAQSLAKSDPGASVLMIAGAKEANVFASETGVDCLTVPSLHKDDGGQYRSRNLRLRLSELIHLRSAAIAAAIDAFRPNVLLVDKVPRGVADELLPTLERIRARGTTRCVLGLREVLDDKAATLSDWEATGTLDIVRRYFDAIWVYGDANVFDSVQEYEIPPDIARKVSFTGYLNQRGRADFDAAPPPWYRAAAPHDRFVLCVLGGGQDGVSLAQNFIKAAGTRSGDARRLPAVLVAGPFMPPQARDTLRQLAAGYSNLHLVDFVPEADWLIQRAERVVAMGGYNTVCSILSFGKPALIVPRVCPRREQLVRARRLESLGLVKVLHPDRLDPIALRSWLDSDISEPGPQSTQVDLNGLSRIQTLLGQLTRAPQQQPHVETY